MFGAIAELIDNACDPDVNAIQFWIDVQDIGENSCLTFMDNGGGMDTEILHRMLSFGFSDKRECNGHLPIGRYGNGFKSGSMRLGQDTLVFTRQHNKTMSVGFLSQTYLEKIDSQTVVVPIVTWDVTSRKIIYPDTDSKGSLDAILNYSIFQTEDELLDQLSLIPTRGSKQEGTRIFIYNLAHDETGNLELDFTSDIEDIRIPQIHLENSHNIDKTESAVSLYRVSLRKYVSILYLRPRMQIFLRGKKVKSLCLSKLLTNKKISTYMPKRFSLTKPIKIVFGQNPNEDEHGIMMFNRNRLIQAFRKNIIRKQSDPDVGNLRELMELVIGVVELDCLTPNHIKQGFQDDNKFRIVELALTTRLSDYCSNMLDKYNETKNSADPKTKEKDTWVQCDNAECQRWRRLPYGTKADSLPEKWYCAMNSDELRNVCGAPEEPEKDPEVQKLSKTKKRQEKPATEAEPPPTPEAATPMSPPPERQPPRWKPSDPVSPSMERVLQSLREHTVVPPRTALNGRHRQPQPTTSSTDLTSPPLAKRRRSIFPEKSPQPVNEQEIIVLDDDDESAGYVTSDTTCNNSTFLKTEPMEIVPTASDDTSSIAVKTEMFTLVPVSVVEDSVNETYQAAIKTDPASLSPLAPDVNSLLQERDELKAKVQSHEHSICDLRDEIVQKDNRIKELESQLAQQLYNPDSQDDVVVIEDTRGEFSDREALKNLRLLLQRYMHHLSPQYRIPTDPQVLENDFANLLSVRSLGQ